MLKPAKLLRLVDALQSTVEPWGNVVALRLATAMLCCGNENTPPVVLEVECVARRVFELRPL